jgi:hypothetical protein
MYRIKYSRKAVRDIPKLKAANLEVFEAEKTLKIISLWSHYDF